MREGDHFVELAGYTIEDPQQLLDWYGEAVRYGPSYYRYRPRTDPDLVTIEDLGAAILLVGQPRPQAARWLVGNPLDLSALPSGPLHETTPPDRDEIIETIMRLVAPSGNGFASAVATKVLHKKRPARIPVLDNRAIFATFLSETWQPGDLPSGSSRYARAAIADALEAVYEA